MTEHYQIQIRVFGENITQRLHNLALLLLKS